MLDWKKLNKKILSANQIVLSTHQNPDGDGLGSASAMYYYINKYLSNSLYSLIGLISIVGNSIGLAPSDLNNFTISED